MRFRSADGTVYPSRMSKEGPIAGRCHYNPSTPNATHTIKDLRRITHMDMVNDADTPWTETSYARTHRQLRGLLRVLPYAHVRFDLPSTINDSHVRKVTSKNNCCRCMVRQLVNNLRSVAVPSECNTIHVHSSQQASYLYCTHLKAPRR